LLQARGPLHVAPISHDETLLLKREPPLLYTLRMREAGVKSWQRRACMISPGIACMALPDHQCQNASLKEWRGVACQRHMRPLKENAP
jgi:hypothetical protein